MYQEVFKVLTIEQYEQIKAFFVSSKKTKHARDAARDVYYHQERQAVYYSDGEIIRVIPNVIIPRVGNDEIMRLRPFDFDPPVRDARKDLKVREVTLWPISMGCELFIQRAIEYCDAPYETIKRGNLWFGIGSNTLARFIKTLPRTKQGCPLAFIQIGKHYQVFYHKECIGLIAGVRGIPAPQHNERF